MCFLNLEQSQKQVQELVKPSAIGSAELEKVQGPEIKTQTENFPKAAWTATKPKMDYQTDVFKEYSQMQKIYPKPNCKTAFQMQPKHRHGLECENMLQHRILFWSNFHQFPKCFQNSPEMFPKPGLPDKWLFPALWTSWMLFYLIWSTQDKQEREVLWPLKLYGYLPILNHKQILSVCLSVCLTKITSLSVSQWVSKSAGSEKLVINKHLILQCFL